MKKRTVQILLALLVIIYRKTWFWIGDVRVRRYRLLDRRVSIVAGGFGRCRSGLRYAVGCVYAGSVVRLGI